MLQDVRGGVPPTRPPVSHCRSPTASPSTSWAASIVWVEGDSGTVIGVSLPLLRRLLAELRSIAAMWRSG
jgi:hypothetical protein